MNDYVNYLNALQASSLLSQDEEQKKDEKLLPVEEASSIPGAALGGLAGVVGIAKTAGITMVKSALRSQMKEVGIDDETIDSVLKGDFTDAVQSKVAGLITKAKGVVQDGVENAKGVIQEGVDNVKNLVDEGVNTAKQTLQEGVETAQNTFQDLVNTTQTQASNMIDMAQGAAEDLAGQAQQEASFASNISLSEMEQTAQGLLTKVSNFFTAPASAPAEIEMTEFASNTVAPALGDIAPSVSSTLSGAVSQIQSGVAGLQGIAGEASTLVGQATATATDLATGLASTAATVGETVGAIAGEGIGDAILGGLSSAMAGLGPLGLIAGLIGGITGAVESSKIEHEVLPTLNPASQFL